MKIRKIPCILNFNNRYAEETAIVLGEPWRENDDIANKVDNERLMICVKERIMKNIISIY